MLALLWRRLAALCGENLSAFQGWPMLPIGGGGSAPLIPHGPVVRGEGWTENTRDALLAMRVQSLDEGDVSGAIVSHPKIGDYVRPATAAGVLDSAVAAAALDPDVAASVPADASPEERWRAAARAVPEALASNATLGAAPNRRALRAFLIQKRWFARGAPGGTVEGARLDLVRSLPIFETYQSAASHHKDADSTEGFVCLASVPPPLLAPAWAPTRTSSTRRFSGWMANRRLRYSRRTPASCASPTRRCSPTASSPHSRGVSCIHPRRRERWTRFSLR